MRNKALFLDRDGTINVDKGYVFRVSDLKIIDGVIDGLKRFAEHGYILIVITNQSGVGRGYFSMNDVRNFNRALCDKLEKSGILISDFYICPHSPEDKCTCRKPSPQMILDAAADHNIDLSLSLLFGDKLSDIKTGENAGVESYLITPEHSVLYWANKLLSNEE